MTTGEESENVVAVVFNVFLFFFLKKNLCSTYFHLVP